MTDGVEWLLTARVARILNTTARRPYGARDVAVLADIPMPTAYHLVHRLRDAGFLDDAEPGRTINGRAFNRYTSAVSGMTASIAGGKLVVTVRLKSGVELTREA